VSALQAKYEAFRASHFGESPTAREWVSMLYDLSKEEQQDFKELCFSTEETDLRDEVMHTLVDMTRMVNFISQMETVLRNRVINMALEVCFSDSDELPNFDTSRWRT
jgi:hypothetical protein